MRQILQVPPLLVRNEVVDGVYETVMIERFEEGSSPIDRIGYRLRFRGRNLQMHRRLYLREFPTRASELRRNYVLQEPIEFDNRRSVIVCPEDDKTFRDDFFSYEFRGDI
jgi:hypothetical protein